MLDAYRLQSKFRLDFDAIDCQQRLEPIHSSCKSTTTALRNYGLHGPAHGVLATRSCVRLFALLPWRQLMLQLPLQLNGRARSLDDEQPGILAALRSLCNMSGRVGERQTEAQFEKSLKESEAHLNI